MVTFSDSKISMFLLDLIILLLVISTSDEPSIFIVPLKTSLSATETLLTLYRLIAMFCLLFCSITLFLIVRFRGLPAFMAIFASVILFPSTIALLMLYSL